MEVHFGLDDIPQLQHSVITVGSFDGVHCGHRKIIEHLLFYASQYETQSVLVTFHPHPRLVLNRFDQSLRMLNTLDEKITLFKTLGIDHVVVVPFTPEFAAQSPHDYIEDFLIKYFKPKAVLVGYDHHFGKGRSGTKEILVDLQEKYNYHVHEVSAYELDGINVSSTKIRQALADGDFDTARKFMGYPFPISGRVVLGDREGRQMGFPTANLMINDASKLIPRHGVYAVRMHWKDYHQNGMMYIGKRPTTHSHGELQIEVHIFDFDGELYGEQAWVDVLRFIRDDMSFENNEALMTQIKKDQVVIKEYLLSEESNR
ncbi:MAG: bifunctional riboflavin kinase/FAD synthetase [Saprospiraceae bacterium]